MAQALLEAWHAPVVVSHAAVDVSTSRVEESDDTTLSGLSAGQGQVSWTETDKSLPYPVMTLHSSKWPQFPPDPFGGETVLAPVTQ
jgi:hypothetical protein